MHMLQTCWAGLTHGTSGAAAGAQSSLRRRTRRKRRSTDGWRARCWRCRASGRARASAAGVRGTAQGEGLQELDELAAAHARIEQDGCGRAEREGYEALVRELRAWLAQGRRRAGQDCLPGLPLPGSAAHPSRPALPQPHGSTRAWTAARPASSSRR